MVVVRVLAFVALSVTTSRVGVEEEGNDGREAVLGRPASGGKAVGAREGCGGLPS